MARGSSLAVVVGLVALGGFSAPALAAGLYAPEVVEAAAPTHKLELSATLALTTDYVFRGISQTAGNPAVQGSFDASYGIFYAGIWGSNTDFGGGPFGQDIANLEIDYYAGIAPTWKNFGFDFAALYYTYPGSCDTKCGTGNLDYLELKTAVSYTFAEKLKLGVANYWSPEYSGELGEADALELSASYAFSAKLFNFFSPSISGQLGWQGFENKALDSYTYWNAGLTLGFLEKWSADVRYWDTDIEGCTSGLFSCNERVVGTVKATF